MREDDLLRGVLDVLALFLAHVPRPAGPDREGLALPRPGRRDRVARRIPGSLV